MPAIRSIGASPDAALLLAKFERRFIEGEARYRRVARFDHPADGDLRKALLGHFKGEIPEALKRLVNSEQWAMTDRTEIAFGKRVIAAVVGWYVQKGGAIVLFDIDETLGTFSQGSLYWMSRPALRYLMPLLKEEFPSLKLGILSRRRPESFQEDIIARSGTLHWLSGYLSRDLFVSTVGCPVEKIRQTLTKLGIADNPGSVRYDDIAKLTVLEDLQMRHRGTNVRLVDDLSVVQRAGSNALYVGDLKPVDTMWEIMRILGQLKSEKC